jgi:ankyrin repeat protein
MDLCEASKEANSETMNFLLSCGEEINKKKTIFGTFPLLEAVKAFEKNKNLEPLQMLITSGAELNEQDTNGWTILHHACEWGLIEVLELVFKIWQDGKTKKVQLNKLTNKNYHLLHIAAMNNQSAIIDFLLTSPIARKLDLNPSAVDGDCCTMLHHAARRGATKALQKILEKSPQLLYEVDIGRNSALHYAAMNSTLAVI